jgi:hypothetical protein
MASGGYRKPTNPAPVSGPGKLARRTDGKQPVMNMTGGKYGENKALREMQGSAPMSQIQSAVPVTDIFAPTQRPNEPVTAGMPFGAGPNSLETTPPNMRPNLAQTLQRALQFSDDPDLEQIYSELQARGEL